MEMSTEKGELFAALAKFQGEVENAKKSSVNPGVKNKYADLAENINTAKPHLAANGLAVTQLIGTNENSDTTLTTMLTHSSGQYISSTFVMVEAKLHGGAGANPAQVLGSSISYQRRYSYASILGLSQEDDDANSVSNARNQQRGQAPQQKPVDMAEKLKSFTSAVSSAKTVQELDKFMQGANKLFKGPELAKAREVYQLKLNEIKG